MSTVQTSLFSVRTDDVPNASVKTVGAGASDQHASTCAEVGYQPSIGASLGFDGHSITPPRSPGNQPLHALPRPLVSISFVGLGLCSGAWITEKPGVAACIPAEREVCRARACQSVDLLQGQATLTAQHITQLSRSIASVAPWNPGIPVEIQTTSRRESMAHVNKQCLRVPRLVLRANREIAEGSNLRRARSRPW